MATMRWVVEGLVLVLASCGPAVDVAGGSSGGDGSSGVGSSSTSIDPSTGVTTSSVDPSSSDASSSSSGGFGPGMVEGDCTTVIEDNALAQYVWAALGLSPGSVIPSEMLAGLESIDAWGLGIETLAGLECATGLKDLAVGPGDAGEPNFVTDLSPLSGLTALETLTMWGVPIDDLSPLATVTALRRLNIRETQVADFSPVAGLPLEWISANGAPIGSVEPLATCSTLQSIGLDSTEVTDLSPLTALPELTDIFAAHTAVADFSAFEGKELDAIILSYTLVDTLPSNMSVRSAQFEGNGIVDVSPLLTWSQPQYIHLENNAIEDAAPLLAAEWTVEGGCVDIYLDGNPLRNAAAVEQLCATLPVRISAGELSCVFEEHCLAPT